MWFKQLSFYPLNNEFLPSSTQLATALQKRPFQHCNGLDWFSEGWVTPARHSDALNFTIQGNSIVALRREEKVLPNTVIRDMLDSRIAEIEEREFRKIGRKEKLALKEQITDDLLPRAFVRSQRIVAYLDTQRHWLMIDTGTSSKAEAFISQLREALPPFPAPLPRTRVTPVTAMTDWVATGEGPIGFELDTECELKDSTKEGAVVRCARVDLTTNEIRQHIATGKQVTRLGLIWRERVRFVLTDTLQLKRLQFLDVVQEEASQAGDDAATLFTATFILMSNELGQLVDELIDVLGGLDSR